MKLIILKRILILFIFFSIIENYKAQNYINYYNIANEAENELLNGNYLNSKEKLIGLESQYSELKAKDYFYLGVLCYILKDTLTGFEKLKKCSLKFGFPTYKVPKYIKSLSYRPSNFAMHILDSIEKKVLQIKSKTIKDTLIYFEEQDQFCRSGEQIDTICDIKNQSHFLEYMKKNGFPNYDLYGDVSDVVFLHIYNEKLYNEYTTFLFEEIQKGNVYPFYYAEIVDRKQFELNLPTIYGSYGQSYNPKAPDLRVLENRRKIGMSIYFNGPNSRP